MMAVPVRRGEWSEATSTEDAGVVAEEALPPPDQAPNRLATAARDAVEAGFDGVEPRRAGGHLIHRFLAPNGDQRTDRERSGRCGGPSPRGGASGVSRARRAAMPRNRPVPAPTPPGRPRPR